MVNIKGLNKAHVLAALFNGSRQQGMGVMDTSGARQWTPTEAQEYISSTIERIRLSYEKLDLGTKPDDEKIKMMAYDYDYVRGRVLKVSIAGDEFDPRLYDRDIGEGAAARVISKLRQELNQPEQGN